MDPRTRPAPETRPDGPLISRRAALGAFAALAAAAAVGCDAAQRSAAAHMTLSLSPPALDLDGVAELALPPRRRGALSGTRFIEKTRSMTWGKRERAVLEELLAGNAPSFVRSLVEVPLSWRRAGADHVGAIRVTPDYVCIGSDDDFVRMPMNGRTAQRLAVATGCVLPTPKLVDEIYHHARVKVTSGALPVGADMMSSEYFLAHDREIEARRQSLKGRLGELTAGPKKDVVLSKRLEYHPGQLAIYGWYRDDQTPIQYLSTIHEDTYVDYAQGVRLVAAQMTLDGETWNIADVLGDEHLCAMLSTEGTVRAAYAT